MYAAVAGGLIVAVLAVAYGTAAPSLGIAEFAPAARQALEAPSTTNDPSVSPAGRGGGGRSTTTTTAATAATAAGPGAQAASTTRVGRARDCYGTPPRQLPDSRSPACAATIFQGDNGGGTTAGVTATEIRVAWPQGGAVPGETLAILQLLFDYFNSRYEFYGRRLVVVPVASGGNLAPAAQRASAAEIAAGGVFAALQHSQRVWLPAWFHELARRRVVSVTSSMWSFLSDREMYDAHHPFIWSVYPSIEQVYANLTSLACSSLVGRPASHAGPALRTQPRKFGVIAAGDSRTPSIRGVVDGLASCGEGVETVEWVTDRDGPAVLSTGVQRLRAAGVTTLICACADTRAGSVSSALDQAGWLPEWLLTGFTSPVFDEYLHQSSMSDIQRPQVFGLQPLELTEPIQNQWWWRALHEMGVADVDAAYVKVQAYVAALYEQLLVLAAGIQAAGPNLTPETFGQGLMTAAFPRAEGDELAFRQPAVGFGPGDHSFINDYALVWWNMSAQPFGAFTTPNDGSWCYVDRGARYRVGSFSGDADSRFFNPSEPCR